MNQPTVATRRQLVEEEEEQEEEEEEEEDDDDEEDGGEEKKETRNEKKKKKAEEEKKMKLVHPRSSLRSKTNDPDSELDTLSLCVRGEGAAARAPGRHFRRIVDRVRDDDGDLEEVLESQGRTTNNNLVGRNRFPHGSRPVAFETGRRCGLIARYETSLTRLGYSLSSLSLCIDRYIPWVCRTMYMVTPNWSMYFQSEQLVKVATHDQRCFIPVDHLRL